MTAGGRRGSRVPRPYESKNYAALGETPAHFRALHQIGWPEDGPVRKGGKSHCAI